MDEAADEQDPSADGEKYTTMTDQADQLGPPERLIQLEKFVSQRDTERWCKALSPLYPGADYWLCHEARVMQGFQRDPRFAARFIAVDLDRRVIVSEAPGFPLTHWLSTRMGELEHPFQRSSDLVRLILASLRAIAHLSKNGLVHGGLRPDVMVLRQSDSGAIDFDSFTLIDFSVAKSAQHRIEKPLFIDLASPDAAYLSPAMREAVERDWQTYAKVCGEPGKSTWYELSDSAKRQYDTVLMPDLTINTIDWRVDLYALSHWFRQISLHRIDYFRDTHQEALPALIKKMQKSVLQGGYTSLEACIKAFEGLEIDSRSSPVPEPRLNAGVATMQPTPVIHTPAPVAVDGAVPPTTLQHDDTFSPAAHMPGKTAAGGTRKAGGSHNHMLGIGVGLVVVGALAFGIMKSRTSTDASAAPPANATPPVETPAAVPAPASAPTAPPPEPVAATPAAPPKVEVAAAPAPVVDATSLDKTPLAEVKAAAEKGDAAAQTQLGLRYRKGLGVPVDNEKAVEWYRRAADQQYAEGQAYLGFMYMTGKGVKKSDADAVKWTRLAAEQGNSTAAFNLGMLYLAGRTGQIDKVSAYRWLKKASEKDDGAKLKLAELKKKMTAADIAKAENS